MRRLAADGKGRNLARVKTGLAGMLLLGLTLTLAMASPRGAAREPQGRAWCDAQGMKASRIHGAFAFCIDGQNRMFLPPKS